MTYKTMTLFTFMLLSVMGFSQKNDKYKTVTISSSTVCEMCIDNIQKGFAFEKGVKSATIDLDANTVTVVYHAKRTNEDKIKKALTEMGYSADELPPTAEGFEKLHYCCRPDHDHGDD